MASLAEVQAANYQELLRQQQIANTRKNDENSRLTPNAEAYQAYNFTKYAALPAAQEAERDRIMSEAYANRGTQGYNYQNQAARSYADAIAGRGSSVAQNQLGIGMQQAQAQAASLAASARGGGANMAAANRQAMTMQGGLAAQANQQAAMLRAQETAQARAGLAGVGGQMNQAGMQGEQFYEAQRQNLAGMQMQAAMAKDHQKANNILQNKAIDNKVQVQQMQQDHENSMAGWKTAAGIGTGVLTAAATSDRRAKEDISDGGKNVDHVLDALKPYSFAYKGNDEHQLGVMAQDMERSGLARAAVEEDASGMKAIDHSKGLSLALASVARLHERLDKVEGRKGGK